MVDRVTEVPRPVGRFSASRKPLSNDTLCLSTGGHLANTIIKIRSQNTHSTQFYFLIFSNRFRIINVHYNIIDGLSEVKYFQLWIKI